MISNMIYTFHLFYLLLHFNKCHYLSGKYGLNINILNVYFPW